MRALATLALALALASPARAAVPAYGRILTTDRVVDPASTRPADLAAATATSIARTGDDWAFSFFAQSLKRTEVRDAAVELIVFVWESPTKRKVLRRFALAVPPKARAFASQVVLRGANGFAPGTYNVEIRGPGVIVPARGLITLR
ncbi:MAG: hypothetical protein K8W52_28070 [Deltaproteobacteria bacterium]|nr:hypothetical protein [Deltaproteobacteria bacterium]